MNHPPSCATGGIALMIVSAMVSSIVIAQPPAVPLSRRGVDWVKADGKSFYGFVIKQKKDEVVIAVERSWLLATYPEQAEHLLDQESQRLQPVLEKFKQRIDVWIADRKSEPELVDFLQSERNRILSENSKTEIGNKRFIKLSFDAGNTQKVFIQPNKRRKIAAVAMKYQVADVVDRPANELLAELEANNVRLDLEIVNLSRGLTAASISDVEWNIRKSMVELEVLGELEMQGQGDALFRKSDQPDVGTLLGTMLRSARGNSISQLGRELGIPEFSNQPRGAQNAWYHQATEIANREGYRGILIKRTIPVDSANEVCVESTFFCKTGKAKWEAIKRIQQSAKLSDQKQADLARIEADPQFQTILKTLGSLGVNGDSGLLQEALRKGAATHAALSMANEQMDVFFGSNTQFLDAPFQNN